MTAAWQDWSLAGFLDDRGELAFPASSDVNCGEDWRMQVWPTSSEALDFLKALGQRQNVEFFTESSRATHSGKNVPYVVLRCARACRQRTSAAEAASRSREARALKTGCLVQIRISYKPSLSKWKIASSKLVHNHCTIPDQIGASRLRLGILRF